MKDLEIILLCTGLSTEEAARRIADALGVELDRGNDGTPVFSRPSIRWPETVKVVGNVEENWPPEEGFLFEESDIRDAPYDIDLRVWTFGNVPDEVDSCAAQREEAEAIYTELIDKLGYPAVLTGEYPGDVYSAWDPVLGRTDFPEGTSSDVEATDGEVLWLPYANPRPPGA